MNSITRELIERVHAISFYSPTLIFDVLDDVLGVVLDIMQDIGIDQEIRMNLHTNVEKIMDSCVREEALLLKFLNMLSETLGMIISERKTANYLPIIRAKKFIEENYMKQITLEDVSYAINLTPSYLSTLFKKEMGVTFTDYLTSCRIENAKRLLKETGLTIVELSSSVGYSDSRYFSKVFHKMIGIKPSAYRRFYL